MATVLDLDAVVAAEYLTEVPDRIAAFVAEPGTIIDLGSGTGTGTLTLARRFPAADVVALDNSPKMLARVADAAATAGLADRVHTMTAELDTALPDQLTGVDVAWASSTLHHFADAEALLRSTLRALRPGGILAVVEIAEPPTFLPADSADGAVELRLREAIIGHGWNGGSNGQDHSPSLRSPLHHSPSLRSPLHHSPSLRSPLPEWAPVITAAGFEIVETRDIVTALDDPPAEAAEYAVAWLSRVRVGIADDLSPADLAVLDRLLLDGDPTSLRRRDDLTVRSRRVAWIARRPHDS
ncbi:Trans-aconitate 2-methyltransferase [Gordonia insulae]|uniref:Trans-aconitate 2-methyltransferase n=2 Tax=Gordonia insulae TaxID=2420509 RepID=A0A3G8JLZ8_9ACTN|nr:Trans-aconitate 2-methyltransferase [Gordonia insulae]